MKTILHALILLLFSGASSFASTTHIDSLRQVYDTLTRVDQKASMAFTIAYGLYAKQPQTAQKYSAEAISLYQQMGNNLWEGKSLRLHYCALLEQEQKDSAFATLFYAEKIFRGLKQTKEMAKIHLDFATLYTKVSDFDDAEIQLIEAKKQLKVESDQWLNTYWNETFGNWHFHQERYDEAVSYYHSIEASFPPGDWGWFRIQRQLGACYLHLGYYEKAEKYYQTFESNLQGSPVEMAHELRAFVLNEYGLLQYYKGHYEEALELFENAYVTATLQNESGVQLAILNNTAKPYLSLDKPEKALAVLQNAYQYRDKALNPETVFATYRLMMNAHKAQGNYSKAMALAEEMADWTEAQWDPCEMGISTEKERFASIKARFDSQIENTLAQEQATNREAQMRYLVGILGLGLLALLVVGIITIWNQRLTIRRTELLAHERRVSLQKQEDLLALMEEEKNALESDLANKSAELKMIHDIEFFKQSVKQAESLGLRKPSSGRKDIE